MCAVCQTVAYDDFLPRLDTLTTPEIDAVYDAYGMIRQAIKGAEQAFSMDDATCYVGRLLLDGDRAQCNGHRTPVAFWWRDIR